MPTMDITIKKEVFNDIYYGYLNKHYRYETYWGGAGSGKSFFIAQKKVYKGLTQKMNLLVVRQTGDTNRDSTFALFKQVITKWGLKPYFKIRESDMRITFPNGNGIIFKGLDDSEKLKSITFENGELTDIWIEEASETLEEDFNQLNIRLRGGKETKNTTISFNPVDINHWLKKRLFDNPPENSMILHTTYKDNKFLQEEDRKLLESYKDIDPYYYIVYCLGSWGVPGKTIFNAQKVSERLSQIRDKKPLKQGFFVYEYKNEKIVDSSIKWIDAEDGYIKIYEDAKPNYPYVIGGDTAGDGSDRFIGQVIDNTTGKQVAILRHEFDEDLYAKQMYCLGEYYNTALIGIETNNSTYPVQELQRLGYYRQYKREVEDTITNQVQEKFGFKTTLVTRPIIIAELVTIVREQTELFNDITTLEEMLTFVRSEKGRSEAKAGAHDDCVMAMAITYYIRDQQSMKVKEKIKPIQRNYNSITGY